MKHCKYGLLIIGIVMMSLTSSAQYIQSLTIVPANPTTADTLTILAECFFPSAGCDDHTQNVFVNGTDIYANALHCLGLLTVICPYTDTITLNPLPAGNYTFHFQLDAGYLPSPCTPGIVPGPNDTLNFVVSSASGINEFISQDAISVFPNPFIHEFQLKGIESENYPVLLELFSQEGKTVKTISLTDADRIISVDELPAAVYTVRIRKKNGDQLFLPALKK